MPVRYAAAILILLLPVGCESHEERIEERSVAFPTQMTEEQIITLCGAGSVRGGEADLAAELRRSGGQFSVRFKNLYAASVLDNREGLQSSDIAAMYESFLQCLDKRIAERNSRSEAPSLPIRTSSILVRSYNKGRFGNLLEYEDLMQYTNTNNFPVNCSYKVYYIPVDASNYTPIFNRGQTISDAKEIAEWLEKSNSPEMCAEFFRNGFNTLALGYYPSPSSEYNDVLEEITERSKFMLQLCAMYTGHIDFDNDYIDFGAGQTKELKLTGIERLPTTHGDGVVFIRQPVLVACWRS